MGDEDGDEKGADGTEILIKGETDRFGYVNRDFIRVR